MIGTRHQQSFTGMGNFVCYGALMGGEWSWIESLFLWPSLRKSAVCSPSFMTIPCGSQRTKTTPAPQVMMGGTLPPGWEWVKQPSRPKKLAQLVASSQSLPAAALLAMSRIEK